jgi:hypothetical protein
LRSSSPITGKELLRFTWLLRDRADYLVDRYSSGAPHKAQAGKVRRAISLVIAGCPTRGGE